MGISRVQSPKTVSRPEATVCEAGYVTHGPGFPAPVACSYSLQHQAGRHRNQPSRHHKWRTLTQQNVAGPQRLRWEQTFPELVGMSLIGRERSEVVVVQV